LKIYSFETLCLFKQSAASQVTACITVSSFSL